MSTASRSSKCHKPPRPTATQGRIDLAEPAQVVHVGFFEQSSEIATPPSRSTPSGVTTLPRTTTSYRTRCHRMPSSSAANSRGCESIGQCPVSSFLTSAPGQHLFEERQVLLTLLARDHHTLVRRVARLMKLQWLGPRAERVTDCFGLQTREHGVVEAGQAGVLAQPLNARKRQAPTVAAFLHVLAPRGLAFGGSWSRAAWPFASGRCRSTPGRPDGRGRDRPRR